MKKRTSLLDVRGCSLFFPGQETGVFLSCWNPAAYVSRHRESGSPQLTSTTRSTPVGLCQWLPPSSVPWRIGESTHVIAAMGSHDHDRQDGLKAPLSAQNYGENPLTSLRDSTLSPHGAVSKDLSIGHHVAYPHSIKIP